VIVQLDAAVEALRDEEPEGAARHIRRARELARESLGEARCSVRALRPEILQKASFCEALRSTIEKVTIGTPLHSEFQVEGEVRELAPEVEDNLLHIGQEALTNALKHAGATEFHARLSFEAEAVRLVLNDNGGGFVVDNANGAGFGLIGMRERAKRISGTLTITSELGAGTTIIAASPYQQLKA
jgi:signal transduction histidine kinase